MLVRRSFELSVDVPRLSHSKPMWVDKKYATVSITSVGKLTERLHRNLDFGAADGNGWRVIRRHGASPFITKMGMMAKPVAPCVSVGIELGMVTPVALSGGTKFTHPDLSTRGRKHCYSPWSGASRGRKQRVARPPEHTGGRRRETHAAVGKLRTHETSRRKGWLERSS